MNADRLLTLYDRVADAPDAIPRLRHFVLDLAVRGKLVEQDRADKPEPELLKRIPEQPSALGDIPSNWCRAEVGELLDLRYGKGLKASERLDDGPVPVFGSNGIVGYSDIALTDKPAVIIGRKGSAGALNICDGPSWTTDVAYYVEAPSFFVLHFLLIAISALDLNSLGKGVKPGLSRNDVYELSIKVPPLAEQRRIVAKVGELMALCDQLDTVRTTRETTRDRLTTASLARLTTLDIRAETLRTHARFALEAMPILTTRPDGIKILRQTILNLAVCGKLVKQDTADEPASKLLDQIARERVEKAQQATGKARRLIATQADQVGLDLPNGWGVEAIGNLVDPTAKISYGVLVPGPDVKGGVPFVRAQDLSLSGHAPRPSKAISPEIEAPYARTRLKGGEILLCVVGSIGKLGVVPQEWVGANIARAVARIAPVDRVSTEYLLLAMRADQVQSYFAEATRTLAQPTLNVRLIERLPIPIPPLAEQHRIVAKVDVLVALCDRLSISLRHGDAKRLRLLDALLHEALHHEGSSSAAEVLEAVG